MRYAVKVKRGKDLETEFHVVTPQHPTGLLLVHTVAEVGSIDNGKYIEITTEDGRKHVLGAEDRVLVVL